MSSTTPTPTTTTTQDSKDHWWKNATGYQVWPASFKDSNNDGIGDIPGLTSKLDYLQDLGIDLIWLSPMYASPWADYGYDISDYEAVHPQFGTLEDMDRLIHEMDRRKMNLILDLVVNHTSDQHAWFRESRRNKNSDNDKRDWYIWRPPRYDASGKRSPPNNWATFFGDSAWEYCPQREEYYFHRFEIGQPDINWECVAARRGVYESAIKFWLKRGIKGFRVDTGMIYAKNQDFLDAPVTDPTREFQQIPRDLRIVDDKMHTWLREMRREALDEFGDVVMISEMPGGEEVVDYIAGSEREYDAYFDVAIVGANLDIIFKHLDPGRVKHRAMLKFVARDQEMLNQGIGWGTAYLENHDTARTLSLYVGDDTKYHVFGAKLLAMFIATLSGTLFLYQGQEIGMTNMPSSWIESDLRDPPIVRMLSEAKAKGAEAYQNELKLALGTCRDNTRTPVQWDATEHAGFTTGKPWMRVNDNYKEVNVEKAIADSNSIRSFWKNMLRVRKQHAAIFVHGKFTLHSAPDDDLVVISKTSDTGQTAWSVLNFSAEPKDLVSASASDLMAKERQVLIHNQKTLDRSKLGPWEGQILL